MTIWENRSHKSKKIWYKYKQYKLNFGKISKYKNNILSKYLLKQHESKFCWVQETKLAIKNFSSLTVSRSKWQAGTHHITGNIHSRHWACIKIFGVSLRKQPFNIVLSCLIIRKAVKSQVSFLNVLKSHSITFQLLEMYQIVRLIVLSFSSS